MNASFAQAALVGAGSSGAHQQILGRVRGGGGSPPVGGDELADSDFENDSYSIAGATKTFSDLWQTDDALGNHDPASVQTGVGYTHSTSGPTDLGDDLASTEELFAALNDPSTNGLVVVVDYELVSNGGSATLESMLTITPDGYPGWEFAAVKSDDSLLWNGYMGHGSLHGVSDFDGNSENGEEIGGVHRAAFLLSPSALVYSVDGAPTAELPSPQELTANTFWINLLATNDGVATYKRIRWLSPDAYTAADLPTLSALA